MALDIDSEFNKTLSFLRSNWKSRNIDMVHLGLKRVQAVIDIHEKRQREQEAGSRHSDTGGGPRAEDA